jgi:hypothetical protein
MMTNTHGRRIWHPHHQVAVMHVHPHHQMALLHFILHFILGSHGWHPSVCLNFSFFFPHLLMRLSCGSEERGKLIFF